MIRSFASPGSSISRQRDQLTAVTWLAFCAAILVQFTWKTPASMTQLAEHSMDLSGPWQSCTLEDSERPDLSRCSWSLVSVPKSFDPSLLRSEKGWIVLRRSVELPKRCAETSCSLVAGEVGDAAEIRLDDARLGQHGGLPPRDRYARHYPLRADLPSNLIRPATQTIELRIRHLKRSQSGVLRGPFAIMRTDDAESIARTITTQNVVIPFVASLGILLMTLLSASARRFAAIRSDTLRALIHYGAASGIFLMSYSSILREYIPLSIAGCLHFALRFMMDWSFLELSAHFVVIPARLMRVARLLYLLVCGGFLAAYASEALAPASLSAWTGFNGAVRISRLSDIPLVAGPYWLAFVAAITMRRRLPVPLIGIMGCLALITLCGVLTFHGLGSLPHFVIFSPFFATLVFSIQFWGDRWSDYERMQREVELGRFATQVAHDIRAPLSALRVLHSDLENLPDESRRLLLAAIRRIASIAESLLRSSAQATHPEEATRAEAGMAVSGLLEEIVEEKKLQYRSRTDLAIHLRIAAETRNLSSRIDRTSFLRAISNLIDNSAEATPEKGDIAITLQMSGAPGHLEVKLADTGKGIPVEVLSKLGARGFTSGKPGGNGLGLYSARSAFEQAGGSMKIESRVGAGTTVIVSLPVL